MSKLRHVFLALLAVMLSPMTANADWIELPDIGSQGFFLDDVTGFTWMDTDAITGVSPQEMAAAILGTGFQLATGAQIIEMSANRGATDWYADGGGSIIGTTTSNATWGYSSESLVNTDAPYPVSFVWDSGLVQIASQNNFPDSHIGIWAVNTSVQVPEPSTLALLGIGLFGMGMARRKKA